MARVRSLRERRAKRLTTATFSALIAIAVVVSLVAGEPVLAIVFAVLLPVSLALGFWLAPRLLDRG